MTFFWPHFFWLLLLPLLMAGRELRRRHAQRNLVHPKILQADAGPNQLTLSPENEPARPFSRLRWRLWLGLCLVTVALARPQWGKLDEPVFDQSREIVIALDLSRSMLSEDVKPSRLERSKLLVSSLLEQLRGERVGLIVFSGTAFLQSPLSADYEILRDFLPSLTPSYMPEGGTNYNALLETALSAFGSSGSADRFLVVLSDGEATDDDWRGHVAALNAKGIRVLGLGVGTPSGSMIPDGSGAFVKDERGAVVLSKLESATLQQLASETNGLYTDASAWVDLSQLIDHTVSSGKKGLFLERSRVRLAERFQWPLALALYFLFWSFFREFPVRPRIRDLRSLPPAQRPAAKAAAAGAASCLAPLLLPALAYSLFSYAPAARAAGDEPASADTVARLVSKLSQRPSLSAREYADFVRTTIAYGKDLQAAQKHVPAGPVNDGLAAVDEGEKLDPRAADWPELRRQLEALLKKKDAPPQPQQSPQQKKEEQKKQDQQQQQNSQQQKQNQPQNQKQQQQQNQAAPKPPPEKQQGSEQKDRSAEKSDQPPQPTDPTDEQKVGGGQEKKDSPGSKDPALAMPLQKLEQIKDQDSPGRLFQLMQNQTSAPNKPGKDW